jgi:hypothetical protein
MQVDKICFPIGIFEKGEPATLIFLEQDDTTASKDMIISKLRETPKVKKILGRKVVLEKDGGGNNKLKITAGLTKNQTSNNTTRQGLPIRGRPGRFWSYSYRQVGQASSGNSNKPDVYILRTFVPST